MPAACASSSGSSNPPNNMNPGPRNRALELAQYVNDIQTEIERVSRENKKLRVALLQNLEQRYGRIFKTTDKVAVMAIFSQWKIIASNGAFRKELAEAETTIKEEKEGYANHLKELKTSYEEAQGKNKTLKEELARLGKQRDSIEEQVAKKREKVAGLRQAADSSMTFIQGVKAKLDSYQPSVPGRALQKAAENSEPADPMSQQAELLKRELHLILQKLDPSHVVPPMKPQPLRPASSFEPTRVVSVPATSSGKNSTIGGIGISTAPGFRSPGVGGGATLDHGGHPPPSSSTANLRHFGISPSPTAGHKPAAAAGAAAAPDLATNISRAASSSRIKRPTAAQSSSQPPTAFGFVTKTSQLKKDLAAALPSSGRGGPGRPAPGADVLAHDQQNAAPAGDTAASDNLLTSSASSTISKISSARSSGAAGTNVNLNAAQGSKAVPTTGAKTFFLANSNQLQQAAASGAGQSAIPGAVTPCPSPDKPPAVIMTPGREEQRNKKSSTQYQQAKRSPLGVSPTPPPLTAGANKNADLPGVTTTAGASSSSGASSGGGGASSGSDSKLSTYAPASATTNNKFLKASYNTRARSPESLLFAQRKGLRVGANEIGSSALHQHQRSTSTFHPTERGSTGGGLNSGTGGGLHQLITVAPPGGGAGTTSTSSGAKRWTTTRSPLHPRSSAGLASAGGAAATTGTSGLLSTKLPGPNFRFSTLPQGSPMYPR
mmetsp:Transcript_9042/g.22105  ORF Transcript_9042/g.22105 Transcript_9042/m.22105 type:complete len:719 (-) Transcript_9042:298-2454(-)